MSLENAIDIISNMIGVDKEKIFQVRNEVYRKNYMNHDDCQQLLELGFPIFDEIATLKNCSKREAKDLIKLREVSGNDFNAILLSNYFINKDIDLRT